MTGHNFQLLIMSSLTRCQLQYVIYFTYFLSYLGNYDLFPPICFSCQRFYKVHLVYSLFYTPGVPNNTTNYLLLVMTANHIISPTCSECLKCKGSHLLVRCPRQAASTEEKDAYPTLLRSYFPIKLKNHVFCSSALPLQICQCDVMNTIDDSTGLGTTYERNNLLLTSHTPAPKF